jgi:RHS repeat-associated protein
MIKISLRHLITNTRKYNKVHRIKIFISKGPAMKNIMIGQKIIIATLSMLFVSRLQAQVKPNGNTQPAGATAVTTPANYSSGIKVNYVRTREAVAPISDQNTFNAAGYTQVKQATQYLDGLGRPLQIVMKEASYDLKDMVSPIIYDAYGREVYKYLPYTSSEGNGSFKLAPFSSQATFMASQYPGESVYYGEIQFEASPLNRVTKSMAPGNSWAGTGRGNSTEFQFNEVGDSVRIWTIGYDTLTGSSYDQATNVPVSSSTYAAGTLYETHTIDEQDNQVVEYKDTDGRVVLKKVQLGSSPGTAHVDWLCTYYVYDDLGLLRFVIPPKAVQILLNNNTWDLTTNSYSIINELSFRYEYDARKRMIAKKVPGAGWVFMVYDKRDRLAYTQDANMRGNNQWMATVYDEQSRPATTGIINYSSNRGALQWLLNSLFDASTVTTVAVNFYAPDTLYVNEYESGRSVYRAKEKIIFSENFNSGSSANFETILGAAVISTTNVLVNYNPLPPGAAFDALTVNYYDDYSFTSRTYSTTNNSKLDDGGNGYPETVPSSASKLTHGKLTGSKVRVIEDPSSLSVGNWLETVSFYDDKGRVVQSQGENYKNGTDITTMRYDFMGKVITTYQVHNNPAAGQSVATKTNMLYDHAGRLLHVMKTLDDNSNTTRYLVRNSYNELGQLVQKREGQKGQGDTTAMEVLDQTYNIRGWLQGINREYSRGAGTKWFGMELNYDWGFTANQYNGNISGQQWRSRGDGERRAFGYDYDKANRILSGDFTQYAISSSAWNTSADLEFTLSGMAYDPNGNILSMQQKGWKISGSTLVDNLSYNYTTNSNKLGSVSDAVTGDNKLGDFADGNTSGDDYSYDSNGNLTQDKNKSIASISYNHLNLPYLITVTGKGTIKYIYDAIGNKLEKRTVEDSPSKSTRTTYLGGNVYQNDTLQFLAHEEGRVRKRSDNSYVYDYFVKDHLGNTRVVLTEEYQQDTYPAVTLEDGATGTEENYYTINTGAIVNNPSSLPSTYQNNNGNPPYNNNPNSVVAATSAKLYKLNGYSGDKTGLGITLKVMSGDTVNILGKSYWHGSSPNNSYTTVANNLLTALAGTAAVAGSGKGATAGELTGSSSIPSEVTNFLSNAPTASGRPKAYVNWILFDEQFHPVGSNSSFDPVETSPDVLKNHSVSVNINRNGFLYVWVSNESNQDVFFDNLQLVHNHGPLLEETHYYPFGLTMAGISSKAAGKLENKYKYNGIELNEDLGVNTYDAFYRNLDQQIGRWWQIDPKLEEDMENWSPYASNFDNPIRYSDPKGDCPTCKEIWKDIKDVGKQTLGSIKTGATNLYNGAVNASRVGNAYNPLASAFEVITGKSTQSDFTEAKPRLQAASDLVVNTIGLFGGDIAAMSAKTLQGTKATAAAATAEVATERTLSPNVQKALNQIKEITAEGGKVTTRPLTAGQELNMSVTKGTERVNIRIEEHTVPTRYGGNGTTPQRHLNVDLMPNKSILPNSGHKILE